MRDRVMAVGVSNSNVSRILTTLEDSGAASPKEKENTGSKRKLLQALGPYNRPQSLGWSNRRIGRHLGRSDMVVARCWQQWITEGRVYRRGGSGRPRNTNDREDRAIRRYFGTNNVASIDSTPLTSFQTSSAIKRNHKETTDRSWLEWSRRPLRRLPLTPHHRQCRLDFADLEATWSVTDWRRVIFSDESRFSL
ncbi:HTH_38 domain-containing protein [Trichonephila clavipes]|nr:HTH_38 domain-containing protein [Trichonephila clavipes]